MSRNMRAADARPANMRRPEGTHPTAAACPEAYSAAVPAKPAAMSAKASEVSATTMPTATAAMCPAATMPAAPAPAGVCFEGEKRNDEEQHDGNAGASRKHQFHRTAELGARRLHRRMKLCITPRTKGF